MKIEPNKFYRTRDGRKARVLCTDAPSSWPVVGYIEGPSGTGLSTHTWSQDGAFFSNATREADLIAEWIDAPEVDWPAMPKWAKAVAMDKGGKWYWHSEKPVVDGPWWLPDSGDYGSIPPKYAPKWSGDWKQSLVLRPESNS